MSSGVGESTGEFRADINGLRAWAVIAVLLFHFRIPPFQGGFTGVDVFFVISGYLMTRIIVHGLEAGSFTLGRFLLARARRIAPALLLLCAILFGIGWIMLLAAEFRQLGVHIFTSLSFLSNVQYWRESGYFDVSSHEKWLLHTWSLSVEWQFYVLLPIILIIAWRLAPGRKTILWVLTTILLISMSLSVLLSREYPSASFYLLHTRAWELIAGGLAFMGAKSIVCGSALKRGLEWLGMLLIIGSFVFIEPGRAWPSLWAAIPVIGTVFVLLSDTSARFWTGNALFQWVGSRSYSLYLWHWPVYVALMHTALSANKPLLAALAIALAFLLAHFSFVLAEGPSRTWLSRMRPGRATAILSALVLLLAFPALYVRFTDGAKWRLPITLQNIDTGLTDKNPRIDECHVTGPQPVPQCRYGGEELGAIVIGDSHASSYVRTVEAALPSKSLHVLDWTLSSCPTLAGVHKRDGQYSPNCGAFVEWALAESERIGGHAPIFIVSRWPAYLYGPNEFNGDLGAKPLIHFGTPTDAPDEAFLEQFQASLVATACRFAKTRPVFMLRPTPEFGRSVPQALWQEYWFGKAAAPTVLLRTYQDRNAQVLAAMNVAHEQCGVTILDPLPYLCDDQVCAGAKSGRPLYYDDDHLTEYGASQTLPAIRRAF